MQKDFDRYRNDISEDISQNILARYLPESMLIERSIEGDRQVAAAVKLVTSNKFDRLLAASTGPDDASSFAAGSSLTASASSSSGGNRGAHLGWVSSSGAASARSAPFEDDGTAAGFRTSVKF
jgi:hypothetical protein